MRLVVDITQLYNWEGRLTGIPRVMHELSSRFSVFDDMKIGVYYVVWNNQRRGFDNVPYDLFLMRRSTLEMQGLENSESRFRNYVKSSLKRSPISMQRALKKLRHSMQPAGVDDLDSFTLKKKDKLLVIWGEWDDAWYRKSLIGAAEKGVQVYQVAHDMLPLVTPQYSAHSTEPLRRYVHDIYPICTSIIAVSKNTQKDVIKWMYDASLSCPPVDVIRLGENFQELQPHQPRHNFFNMKEKFILCVGTIEARKNHLLLYYAYKMASKRGVELPYLVIAGRRGWQTDDLYDLMTTDPETAERFIFLHNADDQELSWLYKNCMFTVYPSHYEGWGLPVAESMHYRTPCIASEASSIPEIAGELVSYFNPSSSEECFTLLKAYSEPENLTHKKQALRTYRDTSWDETFDEVVQVMEIR